MARHGVAGIFGEDTVDVALDRDSCAWTVKAADGRVLLQVPWLWAYDQTQLGQRVFHRKGFLTQDEYVAHSSRWEAFEVCMCAYPLTQQDKQLLERRYPGITSRRQYVVHNPIWQPEVPVAPPRRPARTQARERTTTPVPDPPAMLSTAQDTPAPQVQETAHEAGERKLLL